MTNITALLTDLQEEAAFLMKEIGDLRLENQQLKTRLSEKQEQAETDEKQITILEAEVSRLKEKIIELRADLFKNKNITSSKGFFNKFGF